MTYIEKHMELNPLDNVEDTIDFDCPDDFFCGARSLCEEEGHGSLIEKCPRCWNQEYQNEEVR